MCYCVYIATTELQEKSRFIPNETELYLGEPNKEELENLRDKFSNLHIYYVGSYTNCSCGFDLPSDQLENPVWVDARRSVAQLIDLIKLKSRWGNFEFYCCWAGNTASPVEEHIHLKAGSTSLDNYFGLTENQLIIFEA